MQVDEIRDAMNAAPLPVFTLHLAKGRKLTVKHRNFIWVNPGARTVIVHKLNDSWEAIDVPRINPIEFHAGKDGRRRKAG